MNTTSFYLGVADVVVKAAAEPPSIPTPAPATVSPVTSQIAPATPGKPLTTVFNSLRNRVTDFLGGPATKMMQTVTATKDKLVQPFQNIAKSIAADPGNITAFNHLKGQAISNAVGSRIKNWINMHPNAVKGIALGVGALGAGALAMGDSDKEHTEKRVAAPGNALPAPYAGRDGNIFTQQFNSVD